MISNHLRGILSIKNQTVLKVQSGITNSKNRPKPHRITQNHQKLPRIFQSWKIITHSHPKLYITTHHPNTTINQ